MGRKSKRLLTLYVLLSCIFLLLLLSSCSKKENPKQPIPINGILDLREWDFIKDGAIQTKGYWEFYFGQFINSHEFDQLFVKHYTWVPGVWKREPLRGPIFDTIANNRSDALFNMLWQKAYWKGKLLGATGFASYNLKVLLPRKDRNIGIIVRDQGTAFKLFLNDSLLISAGKVGSSRNQSKPQYIHKIVEVKNSADTINLTVWVSNWDYRKGGLWKSLTIGNPLSIKKTNQSKVTLLVFILGIWVTVSFVLLFFYIYRPKEIANFYLLFWSFFAFIRMLTADDRLITNFFPDFPFELLVKLELISGFGTVPFFLMAMKKLYPVEFRPKMIDPLFYLFLVFLFLNFILSARLISYFVIPFQVLNITGLVYACIKLNYAIHSRREGSIIIGIGMYLVLILYIFQIGYYNQLTDAPWGSGYMAIGFIVAFSIVALLARTFSSALSKVENFAIELEKTVQERTQELIKTQEKLILVAKQTETERVRRRISQDIHDDISSGLNKISWMSELAKIKVLRNKPDELNATIEKIVKSSRETVDNLIEIVWSLNPNSDDLENLLAYMRNYINKFFDDTTFNVIIDFPEHPEKIEINPELKRNLFLVMKEALNNAAKYSKAKNITLKFIYSEFQYLFSITDDGIGLDGMVIQGTGNGMINMRKRMESVKGSFDVISEIGKGTSIRLSGKIY